MKGQYMGLNKKPRKRLIIEGKVEESRIQYIALQELIRLTGISRQTFYNLNRKKLLPFRHLGKLVVINPDEFNSLIDSPALNGWYIGGGISVAKGEKQKNPLKLQVRK